MFSELVDTILTRAGQGSAAKKADAVSYAASTIRELSMKALFHRDFIDSDTYTADADPYVLTKPARFRQMRAVKFVECGVYPVFCLPGKELDEFDYKWYAADTYFAFSGMTIGDTVALGYYRYSRKFIYYATADRPAVYNHETEEWEYHASYSATAELQAEARDLVGHWLLQFWDTVVQEGTLAKFLKNLNDKERAANCYALYKDMQEDITKAESFESIRPARQ
jgi:hypothetical protein